MFNSRQFALDITGLLMSVPALVNVATKTEWKMHLAQEIDITAALEKGRAGKCGAINIVEMPEGDNAQGGVAGVIEDQFFSVLTIEQVDINMTQRGTQLFAEEIRDLVKDALHLHADDNWGTIKIAGRSSFIKDYEGCIAYRTPYVLPKAKSAQTPRTGTVTISSSGGNVTLACAADPTARIFYTVDNTFPSSENGGNSASNLYSDPFPADSGTVIRAVAFADGKNPSEARKYTQP